MYLDLQDNVIRRKKTINKVANKVLVFDNVSSYEDLVLKTIDSLRSQGYQTEADIVSRDPQKYIHSFKSC